MQSMHQMDLPGREKVRLRHIQRLTMILQMVSLHLIELSPALHLQHLSPNKYQITRRNARNHSYKHRDRWFFHVYSLVRLR